MLHVSPVVQQIVFFAFGIVWLGVGAIVFMRARLLQNAYIRRFKHEINFFVGDPIFVVASLRDHRYISRLMHEPQPDAELERIRREIWRRFRYYLIWIFGFPVVTVAVAAFLIATGIVRLV